MLERRLLVQDRESRMFLGIDDGDMSLVPFINRAYKFEDEESAAMTGLGMCDCGYLIYSVWLEFAS